MTQKRAHAEEDEDNAVLSSKRSRASTSPATVSLGGTDGKSRLRSSLEGINRVIGHDNGNDEEKEEDDDDDYTSSSGTSSSSSASDNEDDEDEDISPTQHTSNENKETMPYIPGRPKPRISSPPKSDLLSRISSFLPQLQAANADIEQRLARGESLDDMILDDVKDEEAEREGENGEGGKGRGPYIEMNLGLGVLKEKTKKKKKREEGGISLGDESSSDSDEEDEESLAEGEEHGEGQVMDQLMGLKSRSGQKSKTKPGIQEVDEG